MREIKVVASHEQPLAVRNVGDQLATGEAVVAARWQDSDGVKAFRDSEEARQFLAEQTMPELFDVTASATLGDFVAWEHDQYSHNWR